MPPVPVKLDSAESEALAPRLGDVSIRSHSEGTTKPKATAASGSFWVPHANWPVDTKKMYTDKDI